MGVFPAVFWSTYTALSSRLRAKGHKLRYRLARCTQPDKMMFLIYLFPSLAAMGCQPLLLDAVALPEDGRRKTFGLPHLPICQKLVKNWATASLSMLARKWLLEWFIQRRRNLKAWALGVCSLTSTKYYVFLKKKTLAAEELQGPQGIFDPLPLFVFCCTWQKSNVFS